MLPENFWFHSNRTLSLNRDKKRPAANTALLRGLPGRDVEILLDFRDDPFNMPVQFTLTSYHFHRQVNIMVR